MGMGAAKKTALSLERLDAPGRHAVGEGLYLQVAAGGSKSWLFRYQRHGRQHEMGLGRFPIITLKAARERVLETRRLLANGTDPLEEREAARAAARAASNAPNETFRALAESYIADHAAGWRNPKSPTQWRNTLNTYAYDEIGAKAASAITTEDVLAVLKPIWATKNSTAAKVRGRIE